MRVEETSKLDELADRFEAAEEPSRELFEAAFEAIKGPCRTNPSPGITRWHSDWFAFSDMLKVGAWLDAARTLVPADGWVKIEYPNTEEAYGYSRESERKPKAGFDKMKSPYGSYARATDPALALCAASLRSKAKEEE